MTITSTVVNQQIIIEQITILQTTEQTTSTPDATGTPSQAALLAEINEAGYEMYLSFCAITNTQDGSHPLAEEMYPLAHSITDFINACNEYNAAGYSPPLDSSTQQLYQILTTPVIAVGGSSTLLSPSDIANNIMNPPAGTTSEEWEETLASAYHPGDPDSDSPLWNACELLNTWEPNHLPSLNESFPEPLLDDVEQLTSAWNSINAGNIDPDNGSNILSELASDIVQVNTDLKNLQTSQGYLNANEQMLYDALNAPLQGQFGATLVSSAQALVSSPTQANLDTFGNIVANDNYYFRQVLSDSLNPNPQIYNFQS